MHQLLVHFEAYLMTQKRAAHNTCIAYKHDVTHCVEFLNEIGIQKFQEITKDHLIQYLAFLQRQGISSRTIARTISALRLLFQYLHNHHQIVLQKFDLILPRIARKLPVHCSEKEIETILQVSQEDKSSRGQRTELMLYILYTTGLRVSELVHIKLSDIRYDTGILEVRGKGGKTRIIPLTDQMLLKLKNYVTSIYYQLISDTTYGEYLFPVKYGKTIKPISRQAVWSMVKHVVGQTSLRKDVSPHTLRHSLATHGLQRGWDLRSLQLLLGHENIATVEVYTHIEVSHLRATYNKKHPRS